MSAPTFFSVIDLLGEITDFHRPRVSIEEPCNFASVRRRKFACRDGGQKRGNRFWHVPSAVDPWKVKRHWPVLLRRQKTIHAKAKGCKVAAFGKFDCLSRESLGLAI
jgi:hypothetical protein